MFPFCIEWSTTLSTSSFVSLWPKISGNPLLPRITVCQFHVNQQKGIHKEAFYSWSTYRRYQLYILVDGVSSAGMTWKLNPTKSYTLMPTHKNCHTCTAVTAHTHTHSICKVIGTTNHPLQTYHRTCQETRTPAWSDFVFLFFNFFSYHFQCLCDVNQMRQTITCNFRFRTVAVWWLFVAV